MLEVSSSFTADLKFVYIFICSPATTGSLDPEDENTFAAQL